MIIDIRATTRISASFACALCIFVTSTATVVAADTPAAAISPDALQMQALPPTIVFHGTDDTDVSIEKSRTFCSNAIAAGRICRFVEYPGMGHSFYYRKSRDTRLGVVPFDDTLEKTFAFLDEILISCSKQCR